jgi:hypothetical protein
VKIYEGAEGVSGGSKGESNCQGDDTIAATRWLRDYADDPNGFKWASTDGWEADFDKNNKGVCAVIGGAWHYKTAAACVGETNLGITLIPTFTLTEANVEGLSGVKAGDVYRGGTFADCKVFMINAQSDADKYAALQELVKHLSSKEVQNESFIQCSNVPAYVGASEFIASAFQSGKITEGQYNLAAAQVSMAEWGIPQPFITGTLNAYYYTKQAPDVYKAIIDRTAYPTTGTQLITEEEMQTVEGIRKALYLMEYIWMHGQNAKEFPSSLPAKA